MDSVMHPCSLNWRDWLLPATLALVLHLLLLWLVIGQSHGPSFPVAKTLSVTLVKIANTRRQTPQPVSSKMEEPVRVKPVEKSLVKQAKPVRAMTSKPAKPLAAKPAPAHETVSVKPAVDEEPVIQPAIPDSSADYHFAYLNNKPPRYPNAARRRGLQGRVLLHVEVLAAGHCGHIDIQQSSGHSMLDEAAVEAVRQWRFVPASHAGLAVTRWLHVPVRFELTARK